MAGERRGVSGRGSRARTRRSVAAPGGGQADGHSELSTESVVFEGTVERITYRNDENLFTVARLSASEPRRNGLRSALPGEPAGAGDDWVTAIGHFPSIAPGEHYRIRGRWVTHPRFGRQLEVEDAQVVLPASVNGIEKYLGSGLIKGVGPSLAARIVKRFGAETLDVMEHAPERLAEVEGIGEKKLTAIRAAFAEHRDVQDVMVFLQGYGVTPGFAARVYRQFKGDAIQIVRENPYRLAEEVTGIGFRTADKLAQEMGLPADSPERAAAGLQFALREAVSSEGHLFLPKEELLSRTQTLLGIPESVLETALAELVRRRRLLFDSSGETSAPALAGERHNGPDGRPAAPDGAHDADDVYLPPLYYAERGVAEFLGGLARGGGTAAQTSLEHPEDRLTALERESGMRLAPAQRAAVLKALASGVLVITGGPGTGKTTILKAAVRLIEEGGGKVALASPTGRAAKRLAESTGKPAKTLHRLLEFGYSEGKGLGWGRDEDRPLDADVVVVDEASMVDIHLMHQLLKAVRPGTRLILVGDVDQLPSVGAGSVLRDVITSGTVETVRLTEVFRQAQQSLIVVNAHRVNRGEYPKFDRENDFFLVKEEESAGILDRVRELVQWRLPKYLDCHPIDDIQVLTPIRRTQIGVDQLNETLQEALNPGKSTKPEWWVGGRRFRPGDKVMQVRNNYQMGTFNGDVGSIVFLDPKEQVLAVRFDDRTVRYEREQAEELVLAYATTIHKAQGSEFPAVVMPLAATMPGMMTRNLLYTAITRAKRMAVLVGKPQTLWMYLRNDRIEARYSRLSRRLQLVGTEMPF